MKKDIHPSYNEDVEVTCVCGAKHIVSSTAKDLKIEICSVCHPFYSGQEKVLDSTGRVDRFKKMVAKKSSK